MTLGGAFPRDVVLASVERQIKSGAVIKLRATLDSGVEKEKRFVVLSVTDEVFTCVMNSQIHALIAKNPRRLKCQVAINAADYEFADDNCHFDCSRIFTFRRDQVVSQIVADPSWLLGMVDEGLRDQIVSALKVSPMLSPVDCDAHCKALNEIVLD